MYVSTWFSLLQICLVAQKAFLHVLSMYNGAVATAVGGIGFRPSVSYVCQLRRGHIASGRGDALPMLLLLPLLSLLLLLVL